MRGKQGGRRVARGLKEVPVATLLAVSVASFAVASCSISTYLQRTLISCACVCVGGVCAVAKV